MMQFDAMDNKVRCVEAIIPASEQRDESDESLAPNHVDALDCSAGV